MSQIYPDQTSTTSVNIPKIKDTFKPSSKKVLEPQDWSRLEKITERDIKKAIILKTGLIAKFDLERK
jgi:hypothetical protein